MSRDPMALRDTDDHASDHDVRLADVLSKLCDRVARGDAISFADVATAHPDLADELKELWGAVMLASAVGVHTREAANAPSDSATHQNQSTPTRELPQRVGDYELLEEVGRGGMGVVYRAHQCSLSRDVAVKMLLRGSLATAEDRARLRAEAEAAARLNHPHIVPVYEVGELDGQIFFSMKFVAGVTLNELVEQRQLNPREIASIMAKVARAIDFAHQQGVLHRDLKPSNVLIDDAGEPHLTDFGLAKQTGGAASLTRTGAVLGTPAYMSPEQAAGNRGQVGIRSDVYSLGTILFYLLTGRPPFQARSPVEVVFQVLEQDPPMPRSIVPSVDRDLEMVVLRCLQKPPDLRYPTAGALARDLEAYLNDEPLSARSGRFSQVVGRLFRETHHAVILENWGLLWMWHSLVLLVTCILTDVLYWSGDRSRLHYFLLWTAGLGLWASVFWALRRRMGPVTFVERQIAHVWAASMVSIAMLFPVEYLLNLPVLRLSPILALTSGMVFLIKAGILSGTFYLQAGTLFLTSIAMAQWEEYAHLIFGVVSALCFFIPGWKYYRQRRRRVQAID